MANLQYVQAEVLYAGGAVTQWIDTAPTTLQAPDGIDAPAVNYPYCPEQPPLPEYNAPAPSPPPVPIGPDGYPIAPSEYPVCGDFYQDEDGNLWEMRSDYKSDPSYDSTLRTFEFSIAARLAGLTDGQTVINTPVTIKLEVWREKVLTDEYEYSFHMPYEEKMVKWHEQVILGGGATNIDKESPYYGWTWTNNTPVTQRARQNEAGGVHWYNAVDSNGEVGRPSMPHREWAGWGSTADCAQCAGGQCGDWGSVGCITLEHPCATWTHYLLGQSDKRAFWVGTGWWTSSNRWDWDGVRFPATNQTGVTWYLCYQRLSTAIKYTGNQAEFPYNCDYNVPPYNPDAVYANVKTDTEWDTDYPVAFGFAGWIQSAPWFYEEFAEWKPGGSRYNTGNPAWGQYIITASMREPTCDWVIVQTGLAGYVSSEYEGTTGYVTDSTTGFTTVWTWNNSAWEQWGGPIDFDGGAI